MGGVGGGEREANGIGKINCKIKKDGLKKIKLETSFLKRKVEDLIRKRSIALKIKFLQTK